MFYVLVIFTPSVRAALVLALLYAFATPVFYRTAQLNHNLLVSHFAFFAFVVLWRPWDNPSRPRRPNYLLAGLLCGWTVVLDYSGTVVALFLGLYALCRHFSLPEEARSRYDLFRFGFGLALCFLVLSAYQWKCFGNPFYPAQHYMPAVAYTDRGYRGLDWPQLDLLWQTAFGMRYGLFTSAPLLLLSFYIPGWFRKSNRVLTGWELRCVMIYILAFFVFCAANQYGRIQFNTGVRHIVPVTPFLFLLVAAVLLRMPTMVAVIVGITGTYWMWSLAMYREVIRGMGIFESLIRISTEGFRLPWLTTLERMGYFQTKASTIPLFFLLSVILWGLWAIGKPLEMETLQEVKHLSPALDGSYLERHSEAEVEEKLAVSSKFSV
jgi:hypothetical protein